MPYQQRAESSSGVAITAMILCTVTSLIVVWSAVSVLLGVPLVVASRLPPGIDALGNIMWTIGDVLLVSGTILMWRRLLVGRLLAIIGLSLVLVSTVAFELAALSSPRGGFVSPLMYVINVVTVVSLILVLHPDTTRHLTVPSRIQEYRAF